MITNRSLERRIEQSLKGSDTASYTQRLLREEGLLDAKLREECEEVIEASNTAEVTAEAADLLAADFGKAFKKLTELGCEKVLQPPA